MQRRRVESGLRGAFIIASTPYSCVGFGDQHRGIVVLLKWSRQCGLCYLLNLLSDVDCTTAGWRRRAPAHRPAAARNPGLPCQIARCPSVCFHPQTSRLARLARPYGRAACTWHHLKVTRSGSTTPYQGWAASRTPAFPSSAPHMLQCGLVPQCQRRFGRCTSCCTPCVSMTECVSSSCSPRKVATVSCSLADSRS